MAAAQAVGYYWPTTCGGEARCTTCACEVIEGAAALTPMARAEERALVTERGPRVLGTAVRLACQARVRDAAGEITLNKPGVRPPLHLDVTARSVLKGPADRGATTPGRPGAAADEHRLRASHRRERRRSRAAAP